MKRIVFYSWQANLTGKANRNLIQDALAKAGKEIVENAKYEINPVIDRDTAGIGGTPDIADTIFRKIAGSDLFVADVSIVSGDCSLATPNPNVMVELGYAISELGWDRVLLIQNIFYGGPEKLPFDLRDRRVVTYSMAPDEADVASKRNDLAKRLAIPLSQILSTSVHQGIYAGMDYPLWLGKWQWSYAGSWRTLDILEVGSAGFVFEINVISGSHLGQISGFAHFVARDQAYYRTVTGNDDDLCELRFVRHQDSNSRTIEVISEGKCYYFHGMGVTFNGKYTRGDEPLFDSGLLDEIDLSLLQKLCGPEYEDLISRFQRINIPTNNDESIRVMIGAPPGLFTVMEGIIEISPKREIWCAFNDDHDIKYFSNTDSNVTTAPHFITEWVSKMKK